MSCSVSRWGIEPESAPAHAKQLQTLIPAQFLPDCGFALARSYFLRYTARVETIYRNMNKMLMMLGAAFVWLGFMTMPLPAQETAAEDTAEEQSVSVADMLREVDFATKVKPRKKANVYFFVRSHSGCGPCRALAPKCNAFYQEMKGKGAELIMLNCGKNAESAKAWAKEVEMNYPVVTPETVGKVKVPGGGGTPCMVAVTASGEALETALGTSQCVALMERWKDLVKDARKAEKEKKAEDKKKKSKKKKTKKSRKSEDSDASDENAPDDDF